MMFLLSCLFLLLTTIITILYITTLLPLLLFNNAMSHFNSLAMELERGSFMQIVGETTALTPFQEMIQQTFSETSKLFRKSAQTYRTLKSFELLENVGFTHFF